MHIEIGRTPLVRCKIPHGTTKRRVPHARCRASKGIQGQKHVSEHPLLLYFGNAALCQRRWLEVKRKTLETRDLSIWIWIWIWTATVFQKPSGTGNTCEHCMRIAAMARGPARKLSHRRAKSSHSNSSAIRASSSASVAVAIRKALAPNVPTADPQQAIRASQQLSMCSIHVAERYQHA